jgi:hypothetical protein
MQKKNSVSVLYYIPIDLNQSNICSDSSHAIETYVLKKKKEEV